MRTGRYTISELFGSRHVEQLVIPEIQRDYVWTTDHAERLIHSIISNFNKWRQDVVQPPIELTLRESSSPTAELEALQSDFSNFYSRRTHATNVGFIYAYSDADLPGQNFLIDGQQRLTTIYLALLAVGASKADLKKRFRGRYCLHRSDDACAATAESTRLDYRLREHTADFLHRMVSFLLKHPGAANDLENQSWFLEEATQDTTTRNLVANYNAIWKILKPFLDNNQAGYLYEYLEDLVDCWYFDTNESAQGEELYLYLNARGEGLAANENQKADLLGAIASQDRNEWGQKWEEWQDHFWIHRKTGLKAGKENLNADRGFNSFLECIRHLSKLRDLRDLPGVEQLQSIERHVEIIRWLEKQKDSFKSLYSYAGWVDHWSDDLWEAFNDPEATDWKALGGGHGRDRDQNRLTLVWGSLLSAFIALEDVDGAIEQVEPTKLFRAIRVFYLRSYSGGRSPISLPKLAHNVFTENMAEVDKRDGLREALSKWQFLRRFDEVERRKMESVIWKIEDHPLNLKGADLGGLNLTHLVDLTQPNLDLVDLERIRDAFYGLFPIDQSAADRVQKKKLALVLLFYGAFWHKVSPWYYQNFDFGDWERTIRGKGSAESSDAKPSVFCRFLKEFIASGENLDQFLERKQRESETLQIDPASETDFRHAVLWYSCRLKEHLFTCGMHITEGETSGMGTDVHFSKLGGLWNTGGYFRGRYQPLSHLLKNKIMAAK